MAAHQHTKNRMMQRVRAADHCRANVGGWKTRDWRAWTHDRPLGTGGKRMARSSDTKGRDPRVLWPVVRRAALASLVRVSGRLCWTCPKDASFPRNAGGPHTSVTSYHPSQFPSKNQHCMMGSCRAHLHSGKPTEMVTWSESANIEVVRRATCE